MTNRKRFQRQEQVSWDRDKRQRREGQSGVVFQTQLGNYNQSDSCQVQGQFGPQLIINPINSQQQTQFQQESVENQHHFVNGQFFGNNFGQSSLPPHIINQTNNNNNNPNNKQFYSDEQFQALLRNVKQQLVGNQQVIMQQQGIGEQVQMGSNITQRQFQANSGKNGNFHFLDNVNFINQNQQSLQVNQQNRMINSGGASSQFVGQINNLQQLDNQNNNYDLNSNQFLSKPVFQAILPDQIKLQSNCLNNQSINNQNNLQYATQLINFNTQQQFSQNQNISTVFETVISNQPQNQQTFQQAIYNPDNPVQFKQVSNNVSNVKWDVKDYDQQLNLDHNLQKSHLRTDIILQNSFTEYTELKVKKLNKFRNYSTGDLSYDNSELSQQTRYDRCQNSGGEVWSLDDKVVILFDLNGTLVDKSKSRKGKSVHMRPNIEQLVRLKDKFYLGVFSSAMGHNVQRVVDKIEQELKNKGKLKPQESLFEHSLIKHRGHTCVLNRELREKHDVPNGTCKPLARFFNNLKRVILVDDDEYKSFANERENMLLLPAWNSECDSEQKDYILKVLVDQLLEKVVVADDVRNLTNGISRSLFKNK